MHEYSRRRFIQTMLSGIALGPAMMSLQKPGKLGIPTRPLGSTGERISIIGYGGWDSVVKKTDRESIKLMHEALDNGITFYDNAWEYNDGRSEKVMGKAFAEANRREKIFLMTKVCARDYKNAKIQIEDSLQRLKTDRIDLLQFHSIQYAGDIDRIFDQSEGGAFKAVMEAKEQGKVRFVGFSGHMYPSMMLEMLERYEAWDTMQIPLNIVDAAHHNSFQKKVLPEINKRKMGALGMKSLAGQNAIISRELNIPVKLCRKYALSLPVSTVICGIQTREELLSDIEVARNFSPLTENEIEELLSISAGPAAEGQIEQYKNPAGYFGCSFHAHKMESEK